MMAQKMFEIHESNFFRLMDERPGNRYVEIQVTVWLTESLQVTPIR